MQINSNFSLLEIIFQLNLHYSSIFEKILLNFMIEIETREMLGTFTKNKHENGEMHIGISTETV